MDFFSCAKSPASHTQSSERLAGRTTTGWFGRTRPQALALPTLRPGCGLHARLRYLRQWGVDLAVAVGRKLQAPGSPSASGEGGTPTLQIISAPYAEMAKVDSICIEQLGRNFPSFNRGNCVVSDRTRHPSSHHAATLAQSQGRDRAGAPGG